MTVTLDIAVSWTSLTIIMLMPRRHMSNGVHVSRPLGRLVGGRRRVLRIQTLAIFIEIGLVWVDPSVLVVVGALLLAWFVDDWLTGGRDDGPHRKHEWARVKIRMPKPVKLRPVERAAAPVPA